MMKNATIYCLGFTRLDDPWPDRRIRRRGGDRLVRRSHDRLRRMWVTNRGPLRRRCPIRLHPCWIQRRRSQPQRRRSRSRRTRLSLPHPSRRIRLGVVPSTPRPPSNEGDQGRSRRSGPPEPDRTRCTGWDDRQNTKHRVDGRGAMVDFVAGCRSGRVSCLVPAICVDSSNHPRTSTTGTDLNDTASSIAGARLLPQ